MRSIRPALLVLSAVCSFGALAPLALAQNGLPNTSVISYQGVLENAGAPVNGQIRVRFSLFEVASGGTAIATQTVNNVTATDGVFTANVDFGAAAFALAGERWLAVEVQNPANSGPFVLLNPRQRLGASAFSMNTRGVRVDSTGRVGIRGGNSALSGVLNLSQVSGQDSMLSLRTEADTERWSLALNTGNSNLEFKGSESFAHAAFDLGSGSTAFGSAAVVNPAGLSRVISITGRATGSFPGSAAVVTRNPVNGSVWTVGVNSAGSYSFFHNGVGGPSVVSVPVLQITGGSDIAEPYDVASAGLTAPKPGMVVSIDPDKVGKLRVSSGAYDRMVAGIISGANGVATGLTLTQEGTVADGSLPIAKVGRVWAYVDADEGGAVRAGDLLTTSSTPGHAMKAEPGKSQGAVLGKAMSSLEKGKGMVLVLVGLQ